MPDVPSHPPSIVDTIRDEVSFLLNWCRKNPVDIVLGAAILATLAFFFGGLHLFVNGAETTARWAWLAWNPEQNQEHSKLVPLIFLYLLWLHKEEIRNAPKRGVAAGIGFVIGGVFLYLLSARCLQPRMALLAIPFLLYGSILFLWGKNVARILLFPCAFLIFLIPFNAIEQATFKLQFIITGAVRVIAGLIGIAMQEGTGTTLIARDSSFQFEVIGGCSGIRSLIALTMLSAVYAHLTQTALWKKITIVACSAFFALIGNIGRIVTILLVAKFGGAKLAGGEYHEMSGWLIFPFAIAAMLGVSKLLNLDYSKFFGNNTPRPPLKGESGPGPGHGGMYDY